MAQTPETQGITEGIDTIPQETATLLSKLGTNCIQTVEYIDGGSIVVGDSVMHGSFESLKRFMTLYTRDYIHIAHEWAHSAGIFTRLLHGGFDEVEASGILQLLADVTEIFDIAHQNNISITDDHKNWLGKLDTQSEEYTTLVQLIKVGPQLDMKQQRKIIVSILEGGNNNSAACSIILEIEASFAQSYLLDPAGISSFAKQIQSYNQDIDVEKVAKQLVYFMTYNARGEEMTEQEFDEFVTETRSTYGVNVSSETQNEPSITETTYKLPSRKNLIYKDLVKAIRSGNHAQADQIIRAVSDKKPQIIPGLFHGILYFQSVSPDMDLDKAITDLAPYLYANPTICPVEL